MGKFDKGVGWYTKGIASVPVNFPEDEVCCKWCPFCWTESGLNRYRCRLTNEILYFPNYGLGDKCPVVLNEKNESE